MATRNLRLTNINNSTMLFVDPNDFRRTSKVSWNVQRKSQQGASGQLYNSKWSLASLGTIVVPAPEGVVPSTTGMESTSITTTVSGSVENHVYMAAELDRHIHNLGLIREDLLKGLPLKTDTILVADLGE